MGFGICHRLLVQLSQTTPPDAQPQFTPILPRRGPEVNEAPERYDGVTIIMACRSQKRALKARTKLLYLLDRHVEDEKERSDYDGHAERFQKNVEINFHYVDMLIVQTVFEFCDDLARRCVSRCIGVVSGRHVFMHAGTHISRTSYAMPERRSGMA